MKKITTKEMEYLLSCYFSIRENLIVPNPSWGMNLHECDLLVMSKAGYLTEVEIKINLSDLKKDLDKRHGHVDRHNRIKKLYFALPSYLAKHIEYVPKRAGVLVITQVKNKRYPVMSRVHEIAKPEPIKGARPLTDKEQYKLARLGVFRYWVMREKEFKLNYLKEGEKK